MEESKYKYQCCYCGRKFIAKVPHRCNTGFRKRHHKWLDLQTMEVEDMLGVKSNEEPIAPEYLNVLKEHGCDVNNIAKTDIATIAERANEFAEKEYYTGSYEKERLSFGYYHGATEQRQIDIEKVYHALEKNSLQGDA